MKFRALLVITAFLLLPVVVGCYINDNAATMSMHNAEVRAETERQRIAAQQAEAQAQAQAQIAIAGERTNQQRIDQLGAAERLYSQQNYLIQKQAEGTNRMLVMMGFCLVLIVMIGGGWMYLYLRQNPQPVARQYRQLQYLDTPVSLEMLQSQKAISVGWTVAQDEFGRTIGQRTKANGLVQRVNLLEG